MGSGGNGNNQNSSEGEQKTYQNRYRNEIQGAIENGTLVMETSFMIRNRNMVQENNHYHYGMELEFEGIYGNKIRIRVRAEFQEGKVIAINIDDEVMNFGKSGYCNVYFDGQQIRKGIVDEVISGNGKEAKYVGEMGEGGAQFLIYIPHFSEHIIEIESLYETAKEELFSASNYAVMGFAILALIGISGHVYKIGKSRK
jgi:hypothetical protein